MAAAVPARTPRLHAPNRYWVVPAVRAIIAVATAAVITFTRDAHTPEFGLVVFGVFALADGLATGILSLLFGRPGLTRTLFAVQGAIGVVAGILALALLTGGLALFLYIVTVWAALTGFLELYSGFRGRGLDAAARDWLITGAITALFALALLIAPADAVLAIGLFGAWAVIVGVFQAIGAVSLRGAARSDAAQQAESGS